jgi:cytochrome P450
MASYTFSDGTTVPAGTFLGAPTTATHLDHELYPDPEVFEPKRYLQGDAKGSKTTPQQLVATSPTWIPFGHGKSACPGRMFAVS